MLRLTLAIIFALHGFITFADEEKLIPPWQHESEASLVRVKGNTNSESISGKQKTVYTFSKNALTATGRYLQTKAAGVETAKAWDAALRYERLLSDQWSAFVQYGAESDRFAGYLQRDNADVGGKYILIKKDNENLFAEAGYRNTHTLSSTGVGSKTESFGRLYTEYSRKLNEGVSAKFWVEYLPNFTHSDAYLLNYEPSITAILTSIFSLKTAYLVKYHNKLTKAGEKYQDETLSAALVAKF